MKFRKKKTNKKIGYYAYMFKKIGKGNLLDESFIYSTGDDDVVSPSKIGEFAIFNADLLGDTEKAEKYFKKAIEKDPKNSFWLGNYAVFLHYYKKDLHNAARFYLKSLENFNDDPFILYNYAILLLYTTKNHNKIEALFRKAIELEPENSKYECGYAAFLFKIRKNFAEAEKICIKLTTKEPKNADWLAAYSQLKLLKREYKDAEYLIDKVFKLNPPDYILLEMWFYRYAHFPQWHEKAEFEMNKLIKKGIKTVVWGLQQNVMLAIFSGHPYPEKLEEYAKLITEKFNS